jgi:hypothetical protein
MRHLEIMPGLHRGWCVRYEDDATDLSTHDTLADAETEARSFADQMGCNVIHIYERDGDVRMIALEPGYRAPTPSDVKGPSAF